MITNEQYSQICEKIVQIHSEDPSQESENGIVYPAELIYSQRMLQILDLFRPENSEILKIAAQCQHLKRWGIPRSEYPFDRRGYHEWRRVVMTYQLGLTQNILSEAAINQEDLFLILNTLKNQGDKSKVESQIIMDTACLVFLKWYMEPFAKKHESEKVTDIMKKTIRKMSKEAVTIIPMLGLNESARTILDMVAH